MSESNPYSSPRDTGPPPEPPDILRDGKYLVVRQTKLTLPGNCSICNASETGRLMLKIRKAPRILAVLGLMGAFICFSVPAARIQSGLCKSHLFGERIGQRLYKGTLLLALAWIVFAIACAVFAVKLNEEILSILSVLAVASAILFVNLAFFIEIGRPKLLRAVHSDRQYIWLDTVSADFLSQFPAVGGPPEDPGSTDK